jgi:hypothetical protein
MTVFCALMRLRESLLKEVRPYPDDLAAYEAVYVSGLQEVGRLLNGVKAEPL